METSCTNAQYNRNNRYNLLYEIELILSVLWIFFIRQTRQIQRYGNQGLLLSKLFSFVHDSFIFMFSMTWSLDYPDHSAQSSGILIFKVWLYTATLSKQCWLFLLSFPNPYLLKNIRKQRTLFVIQASVLSVSFVGRCVLRDRKWAPSL